MSDPIEPYYQIQAKNTVDHLFDAKYFHPDLTRDGMQAVEDLLAFMFQSQAKSAVRCAEMSFKIKPHAERLAKLQETEQPGIVEVINKAAEDLGRG